MLADPDGEVYGRKRRPPAPPRGKTADESIGMRGMHGRVSSFVCTTPLVGGSYAQKHDGQPALSFSSCLVLDRLQPRLTVFGKEQTRQRRHQQCSICGYISVALPVLRECNTADQPRCNRKKNSGLSLPSNPRRVWPSMPLRPHPSKTRFCHSVRRWMRRRGTAWSVRTASLTAVPRAVRKARKPARSGIGTVASAGYFTNFSCIRSRRRDSCGLRIGRLDHAFSDVVAAYRGRLL